MTKLTQSERETVQQLLLGGWTVVKVAHGISRMRDRRKRRGY